MSRKTGYGQYCPIAVAAEVLCERWTPLLMRAMICGSTRYSEIRASVPRMSTALLSRRLADLETQGIVETRPIAGQRGRTYHLTTAGRAAFPVLEAMGMWSQRWLRRDITRPENLDPDVLMWELRHAALAADRDLSARRVVEFRFARVKPAKQRFWLVFEPGEVDVCVRDPGFPVDLWVSTSVKTVVEVWLGYRSLRSALQDGSLRLDGESDEVRAFGDWFTLSRFAAAQS
jgi:DNA-binding HxlR family transcriptional regulator